MDTVRQFEPVYGYGWHHGESAIDIPAPFGVTVTSSEEALVSGLVREPHKFSGSTAILSLRSQSDGLQHWSVVLTGGHLAATVTGFAVCRLHA